MPSFPAFTFEDPSLSLPEEVFIALGMAGLQISDDAAGYEPPLRTYKWQQIKGCAFKISGVEEGTFEDEMDLFTITTHEGTFWFECDNGSLLEQDLKGLWKQREEEEGDADAGYETRTLLVPAAPDTHRSMKCSMDGGCTYGVHGDQPGLSDSDKEGLDKPQDLPNRPAPILKYGSGGKNKGPSPLEPSISPKSGNSRSSPPTVRFGRVETKTVPPRELTLEELVLEEEQLVQVRAEEERKEKAQEMMARKEGEAEHEKWRQDAREKRTAKGAAKDGHGGGGRVKGRAGRGGGGGGGGSGRVVTKKLPKEQGGGPSLADKFAAKKAASAKKGADKADAKLRKAAEDKKAMADEVEREKQSNARALESRKAYSATMAKEADDWYKERGIERCSPDDNVWG
jgi:hypothetical protein